MKTARKWVDFLSDEDLAFAKRLILTSGSLKDVAAQYGISYPTVRLRLDRLIAKIQVFDSAEITTEFERTVRSLCAENRIDTKTMKILLNAHHEDMEGLES